MNSIFGLKTHQKPLSLCHLITAWTRLLPSKLVGIFTKILCFLPKSRNFQPRWNVWSCLLPSRSRYNLPRDVHTRDPHLRSDRYHRLQLRHSLLSGIYNLFSFQFTYSTNAGANATGISSLRDFLPTVDVRFSAENTSLTTWECNIFSEFCLKVRCSGQWQDWAQTIG